MTFRRRQLLGRGLLVVAALLGGAWLLQLDFVHKISSDVLDLIPDNGTAPELTLIRSLASEATARTMEFVLTLDDGQPAPAEAATQLAEALGREPAFDQAVAMGDSAARDQAGRELFAQRFTLLFPIWLHAHAVTYATTGGPPSGFSAWLAHDTTATLDRFLATPGALAFQDLIPADPLLLLPGAVDRLQDGLALAKPAAAAPAATLVWARLAASPFSVAGQEPAFAAIARAGAIVRVKYPGLVVADTGVNRFAAASRARIQHEVAWLNLLSLGAVLAVAGIFIRQVFRGLHLLPVVLWSTLGAWVAVTAVFDKVHVLVFVVGSLLTGVAIDYGFYLFMQPPATPDEEYPAKVRRLAKPLLASCLTTVAGFSLLLFSELPFIRQLGVYVGAGLICALATAVVYFATVRNPFLAARELPLGSGVPLGLCRSGRRLLIALWLLALPGLGMLRWHDDIRELQVPTPELTREADRINTQFGEVDGQTVYLTFGDTAAAARDSLEKFQMWLKSTGGGNLRTIGLAPVIPTSAMLAETASFEREQPEFPEQLRRALVTAGYDPAAFAPFFTAYADQSAPDGGGSLESALDGLQRQLTGPMGLLLHTGRPLSWFVTLATGAPSSSPPAETQTVGADELQSINRVFSRYRQSALTLSLIGLALVGTGVLFSYGWRDGARIFALPCGACLGLFGVFGWLGQPLNLFYLLGAFLGVCLTHNYSVFTATSAYRGEAPPVSVRLSALTAAASFGVLALSGIPVVRALGATVALIVLGALLLIECEHLGELGKKP